MKAPSLSFPREWILKKADDFQKLYREGTWLRERKVTVIYRPAEAKSYRVGFSTRKKMGNAVRRNRARRLMREVFRLHQHEVRRGFHYLFLWTGEVDGTGFRDAEKEIIALLTNGGLIINKSQISNSKKQINSKLE